MQLEHFLAASIVPVLAEQFRVAAIHGKRLLVITPSATWASRLKMQAPELLETLHQAGFTNIRFIEVRVAPLTVPRDEQRVRKRLSPAARQALDLMEHLVSGDED